MQSFEGFDAFFRRADVRLDFSAQILIAGRERHLHDTFCFPIDGLQKIQIPQYPVRLGHHHPGKLHSLDASSCQQARSAPRPKQHSLGCNIQKKASVPEKETEACHARIRDAYLPAESAISMADLNKS